MSTPQLLAVLALVIALPSLAAGQRSPLVIEVEGGPVWQSRNNVEIPNDGTASRFSLIDLQDSGPWPGGRLYVTWNLNDRHGLRLLLAPLSVTEAGVPGQPLHFAGEDYASGQPAEATYTFNSYRLSYRYRIYSADRTTAWVGGTAKIRDATVALEQGGVASRKDNVGFVPLLHLAGEWRFASDWQLGFDAEALAGGPGRAVDAALRLGYDLGERWTIRGGYRTVEGGADVAEVYNFAWLHYGIVSVAWRL